MSDLKSSPSKQGTCEILFRLESQYYLAQNAQNWAFGLKFLKINVRFPIITFEIGYMRNFVRIQKLILFGPKCPKLGIWAQNFGKQISDLKSAPSKQSTCQILLKDQKDDTFWPKRPKFGQLCSQFWKTNVRFEIINFEIGYK